MKLLDTCEPVFQYICRLNRSARKGGHHTMQQVTDEIKHLLKDIRAKAKADPEILSQMQQGEIYLALLGFIDFMVRNSSLPFALDWPNLAWEYKEMGMDEKFFELLDKTLADRSDAATERVAFYFTCLGMGFTGFYTGQPEYLRRKMLECASRLRGLITADDSKVCPEAYNADTRVIESPVGASLAWITVTLVLLIIAVFAINVFMYWSASDGLRKSLSTIGNSNLVQVTASPSANRNSGSTTTRP